MKFVVFQGRRCAEGITGVAPTISRSLFLHYESRPFEKSKNEIPNSFPLFSCIRKQERVSSEGIFSLPSLSKSFPRCSWIIEHHIVGIPYQASHIIWDCGLLSPFLGQIILQKTFVVILGDERHMMRITMRFAEQLLPSGAFHPAEKQQQFVAAGCS